MIYFQISSLYFTEIIDWLFENNINYYIDPYEGLGFNNYEHNYIIIALYSDNDAAFMKLRWGVVVQ